VRGLMRSMSGWRSASRLVVTGNRQVTLAAPFFARDQATIHREATRFSRRNVCFSKYIKELPESLQIG
jgi:hypothetical protein